MTPRPVRTCLGLLVAAALGAGAARAQPPAVEEVNQFKALRPPTPRELDRREARRAYARGLVCARCNDLFGAVEALEKALRLDPDAAPPRKALAPLYLVLGRRDEALAACRKVLDLDPADYETWHLYARQLKARGQLCEAAAALARALACPALRDATDLFVQVSFDLGAMCEEAGENERALAVYGDLAAELDSDRTNPRGAEAWECLGRTAMKARRYGRAVEGFTRAQERLRDLDPLRARTMSYALARACRADGRPAEALRRLDDYLLTQPPGTEAHELKAELLRELGRSRDVLPALEQAADRDPHNVALQLLLARQYVAEDKAEKAEACYRKLAEQAPGPDVYRGLFGLYQARHQMDQAVAVLDQAFRGVDGDSAGEQSQARAMLQLLEADQGLAGAFVAAGVGRVTGKNPLQPRTLQLLAVLARRADRLEAAETYYRSCLRTPFGPGKAQVETAVYAGLLEVLYEAGKYEAAVELCRRGLKKTPAANALMFHNGLARSLSQLGRHDEALAEADQVIRLADDTSRLHYRLVRVGLLQQAERYDRAEAECRDLLDRAKLPQESRDVRYVLSNVYTAAGQPDKAEQTLRQVLRDNPDDALANNNLGYELADRGKDLDEAEALIRKAIRLDREQKRAPGAAEPADSGTLIDSLGWVLFRRGQVAEARRQLEKAAALPDAARDPVVWDHLGEVCLRAHDPEAARRAWKTAAGLYESGKRRKLDRQYQDIRRKLEGLQGNATQR